VAVELMSPVDEEFFDMDRDPRMISNVGVVYVLEQEVPPAAMLEALLGYVDIVPRARQRVVRVDGRWAWSDVEEFDHERHLEYRSIGPNASLRRMADELSGLYSRPWDMRLPLVRATVLEGLAERRSAVFIEVSHALGDGLGLLHSMRSAHREARDGGRESVVAASARDAARFVRRALCDGGLRSTAAQMRSFAGHARDLAGVRRRRAGAQSSAREIALLSVELDAWREAARRRNGRINDLFLATAATALRDTLGDRRRDRSAIDVVMPISIRPPGEGGAGNQVWRGLVRVPGDGEPLHDLRVVARASAHASRIERLPIGPLPERMLRLLPARARRGFMRHSLAAADGVATNMTFPFEPMQFAGTRVLEHYVVAPVTGPPVLFALCTYADVAHFSLTIDPGLLPDPGRVRERFAELVAQVAGR